MLAIFLLLIGLLPGCGESAEEARRRAYNEAYSAGEANGRRSGFEKGRGEGYATGREDGMRAGEAIGFKKGQTSGYEVGKSDGVRVGIAEGREEGLTEGRSLGRREGIAEGRAAGLKEGFELGKADMLDTVFPGSIAARQSLIGAEYYKVSMVVNAVITAIFAITIASRMLPINRGSIFALKVVFVTFFVFLYFVLAQYTPIANSYAFLYFSSSPDSSVGSLVAIAIIAIAFHLLIVVFRRLLEIFGPLYDALFVGVGSFVVCMQVVALATVFELGGARAVIVNEMAAGLIFGSLTYAMQFFLTKIRNAISKSK